MIVGDQACSFSIGIYAAKLFAKKGCTDLVFENLTQALDNTYFISFSPPRLCQLVALITVSLITWASFCLIGHFYFLMSLFFLVLNCFFRVVSSSSLYRVKKKIQSFHFL